MMFGGVSQYKVVAFEEKLGIFQHADILINIILAVESMPCYATWITMWWEKHVEKKTTDWVDFQNV